MQTPKFKHASLDEFDTILKTEGYKKALVGVGNLQRIFNYKLIWKDHGWVPYIIDGLCTTADEQWMIRNLEDNYDIKCLNIIRSSHKILIKEYLYVWVNKDLLAPNIRPNN